MNPIHIPCGVILMLAVGSAMGCGNRVCGEGTVEQDGVCVAGTPLTCGVGFKALGTACVPDPEWVKNYCGPFTEYKNGRCEGKEPTATCDQVCPPVSGGTICVSGQAYNGMDLLYGGRATAKPVPTGAEIGIYNPVPLIAGNMNPPPEASSTIYNDQGCFLLTNVTIPFTGNFVFRIKDGKSGRQYAQMFFGHIPVAGKNSDNVAVPAFEAAEVAAWPHNLIAEGFYGMWHYYPATLAGMPGVVPTIDNQPPPWTDGPGGPFYFAADRNKVIDDAATATTSAGLVVITKAQQKQYTGQKANCTFVKSLGGSFPGWGLVVPRPGAGTGC